MSVWAEEFMEATCIMIMGPLFKDKLIFLFFNSQNMFFGYFLTRTDIFP